LSTPENAVVEFASDAGAYHAAAIASRIHARAHRQQEADPRST